MRAKFSASVWGVLVRSWERWKYFVRLEISSQVLLCMRAQSMSRKYMDAWKFQFKKFRTLRERFEKLGENRGREILKRNFRVWEALVAVEKFWRRKFPIVKYFRAWRNFCLSTVTNIHLHVVRADRKFMGKILQIWRENFHARLRKRIGNLKLLSLTANHLEISRTRKLLGSWRNLAKAEHLRKRKFLEISVLGWRRHVLRRQVKNRRLEISLHKYLLDKSSDFARLLISTLDVRKARRMQHLMAVQQERMEIFHKYFRLWRDLAN